MTKLAIFDLDGTLLNTIGDLAASCNYALEQCGCPPRDLSEYNMLVGRGIYNLFRGALPEDKRSEEMVRKMAGYFVPYYDKHLCDLTRPYPGIVSMLGALSAAGIKMGIATNKYQAAAEMIVEHYFGQFGFVGIMGQADDRPIKPSPDIVMEIMKAVPGATLESTVYIGDSDVDMETGRNAGVRTVGVTWGFRTREEIQAYSPWMLADNAETLTAALLEETETIHI